MQQRPHVATKPKLFLYRKNSPSPDYRTAHTGLLVITENQNRLKYPSAVDQ